MATGVIVVHAAAHVDIEGSIVSLDIAAARDVLAAQLFSALLGAELLELGSGMAMLQVALREELLQEHGPPTAVCSPTSRTTRSHLRLEALRE